MAELGHSLLTAGRLLALVLALVMSGTNGGLAQPQPPAQTVPDYTVPLPDPIRRPSQPDASASEPADDTVPSVSDVLYDPALLPEPVRRLRQRILDAAASGDPEALRPWLSTGAEATQLSFGEAPDDPIEFLIGLSGDMQGQEILAILYEVLDSGYVVLDQGTPNELYVWPYFYAVALEDLRPQQRVELFKLVTAGDYEEMKLYGSYIFYRAGISAEGSWRFFVAGD